MFLGLGDEQCAGVLGVADGGLGIKTEDGRQVERIGANGKCFVELSLDA
ncbi:unnamed protein product [[Actinomadura] parvosata subsp. kistnae]|nr:unnamed protein product [Actinomadura parvosata subsp. kistnae]SPL88821.1 unnamed protein product [Actinomadura parvosata subsp. kistnae]